MDTKLLERFATEARRDLLASVDARATAVLSPGSVARSERSEAIKRLEAEIAVHGRGHVIDKVAYTWFNRIIALRFMDARGYTDAGVVSPARGQVHGQPEILADAKRGNLDTDVVIDKNSAQAVLGLLDGTRKSADAEGEAYALLLTDYCRYWHKSMPFMFEREGDYTELLVPTGLLADGAILSRAREALTEDVCDDVEVIGWLYQFYISERKDEVFAGFKKNKKAGVDEIPAATQLFTPHWIVRYLVENSLGRLWMLNRPTSRLVDQMDYYIAPVDEATDFLKITDPEELTVIDPACGSGHMLTYAFDLLYAIYEEEGYAPSDIPGLILAHNLHGTEIDPRAGSLAAFALTMKARAKLRTFFNKQVEPKICVIESISLGPDELDFVITKSGDRHEEEAFWSQFEHADTLGSLIRPDADQTRRLARHAESLNDDGDMLNANVTDRATRVARQAEFLIPRYSVVVANPPYMGAKSMNAVLTAFAKSQYGNSKSDLFAMFIERCVDLTVPNGMVGMITMQSWMFGSSLGQLRSSLLARAAIRTMAHLGSGAFDTINGEVVSTTAFTLELTDRPLSRVGVFADITRPRSEAGKQVCFREAIGDGNAVFALPMSRLADIPGKPIAYWASPKALAAFRAHPSVSTVADLKAGISTGDNTTYERQWYEVSWSRVSGVGSEDDIGSRRWTPCSSGGRFRRWYGNNDVLMDWEGDGKRIRSHKGSAVRNPSFMGRAGLTYSKIGGARFAVRYLPSGFVFDDTGRMIFPHDRSDDRVLAALLNSSTAQYFLDLMSPGLTFTSNEIGNIPWAQLPADLLAALADRAIEIAKGDWDSNELSWDFRCSPLMVNGRLSATRLSEAMAAHESKSGGATGDLLAIEAKVNASIAIAYGMEDVVESTVPIDSISLSSNPAFMYGSGDTPSQTLVDSTRSLVSYAVGCMFGRYSLDEPGLILADQGTNLQDYLAKVPSPGLRPDTDNVIPFVDDGWFEDDIVERFRQFLRAGFGTVHFEENLRFVEESLGVKTLRDYFITKAGKSKFYDDHVQRYKKRPIYWMFSSSRGSFNALIYMHRYNPSTVSTVLNEYLREYRAKLEVTQANAEKAAVGGSAKDHKEADRLRRVIVELDEYEHNVLFPLAAQNIAIDLDDGVKANYPKFYPALKKITGIEAAE